MALTIPTGGIRIPSVPLTASPYLQCSLHWLFKKQYFPKYRLSRQRKIVRESEAFGDVLIAIFEMCKEVYAGDCLYRNGLDWFDVIVQDIAGDRIKILDPKPENLPVIREAFQELSGLKNPVSQSESVSFSLLLSRGISLASQYPGFRQKRWEGDRDHNGLLVAYQNWMGQVEGMGDRLTCHTSIHSP